VDEIQLNLARKWRSQQFGQIVGQDLSIRILKNSLFLGKFFPVYLFSGQHGCGKTTTARVFAAAVNCECLTDFQQNPKKFTVPCLKCDSCKAMLKGKHPDFIEMDAASHTGVDNVRQIIEGSALVPLIGRKKIYLIDEAHMLSKAAFNAFLKILEEPPESVFFILATTDEHKIIDTVRSRCFQLFFNSVEKVALFNHLKFVCEHEEIVFKPDGLELIVKETGGAVRDALNLLEQVCFSAKRVGKAEVLNVLGYLPEETLLQLFIYLLTADSAKTIVNYIAEINVAQYNSDYVWKRFLQIVHAAVWIKCGVVSDTFSGDIEQLRNAVHFVSLELLTQLFDFFCQQEPVFLKTIHKTTFLQLFFVQAWQLFCKESLKGCAPTKQGCKFVGGFEKKEKTNVKTDTVKPIKVAEKVEVSYKVGEEVVSEEKKVLPDSDQSRWDQFLKKIDDCGEPLLSSIFKQARFEDLGESKIKFCFTKRLSLFNDTIEQMKNKWQPVLFDIFGDGAQLEMAFVDDVKDVGNDVKTDVKKKSSDQRLAPVKQFRAVSVNRKMVTRGVKIDVSDKNSWPLTNKLLNYFPGTVLQLPEPKNKEGYE